MSKIIQDLEKQAYKYWKNGDYYISFLLFHSLLEGALRDFLKIPFDKDLKFSELIDKLQIFLTTEPYKQPEEQPGELTENLKKFNKARNKLIHNLWKYGYSDLNKKSKRLAQKAFITYNLELEYLATFDEEFQQKWGISEDFNREDYQNIGELKEWLKDFKP